MEKVLEITKLAMEVNKLGKHQVFVYVSPHVRNISVTINESEWHEGKEDITEEDSIMNKNVKNMKMSTRK